MTTAKPLSRFAVPDALSLPEDLRTRVLGLQEKMGFVPNVFLAMGHRPQQLRAFMMFHDDLMESNEGLTQAEREMIVVATSNANNCLYCVVSHGAVLRIRAKDATISEKVAVNYRDADLSERQVAMLDYAMKLSQTPGQVTAEDFATLRAAGFDEATLWDIGAIVAFFAMSNRFATHTAMWPNPEFYGMAR